MRYFLVIFFVVWVNFSFSQDENIRYEDHIYQDNIRSVSFHIEGIEFSYPMIFLGSGTFLELSFDDISLDAKDYVYTVEHCDKDWKPSSLSENEYIDGFLDDEIELFDFSFNTREDYTHYSLVIPNRDFNITISGNYLLKIYEDETERQLILTRRFMVIEPISILDIRTVRPADVSKRNTHQELDFTMEMEGFEIRNPRTELFATVLQNGRWDNAIRNISPKFIRSGTYIFDYQDKIVFSAGKEFRFLDLRDFERKTNSIQTVYRTEETFDVYLHKDEKRGNLGYFDWPDNNGMFIIDNQASQVRNRREAEIRGNETISVTPSNDAAFSFDIFQNDDRRLRGQANFDAIGITDADTRSEYADVFFQLYSPTEYYDYELFLFGAFTDWTINPNYKMIYNPTVASYVAKIPMKQGVYDYVYALVPKGTTKVDLEETEGNWHEAENEYLVLMYYSRFGGRYDRLIGAKSINSRAR